MQPQYGQQTRYNSAVPRSAEEIDEGLRAYMLQVYNYLGAGLLVAGLSAYVVSMDGIFQVVMGSPLRWVVAFAPLGIMLWASFGINKMSARTLTMLYWSLTAFMGAGLSSYLYLYTGESVAKTLLITACTFGAMSLYGYTTKRSLANWGSFLMMGVIGLLLASVVNIFMQSSALGFAISAIGVLIFTALIAYDTQQIKGWFYNGGFGDQTKNAVFGAMQLFIDVVILFQYLMAFFGERE